MRTLSAKLLAITLAAATLMANLQQASAEIIIVDFLYRSKVSNLQVRSRPELSADTVAILPMGTYLAPLENLGTWSRVAGANGINGYVLTDEVQAVENDTQVVSPVPEVRRPIAQNIGSSGSTNSDPLRVRNVDLDCNEDYNGGFRSCEVEANILIEFPRIFVPYLANYSQIECDTDLRIRGADGRRRTLRGRNSSSIFFSSGRGSGSVSMRFNMPSGWTVVEVDVVDLDCKPE